MFLKDWMFLSTEVDFASIWFECVAIKLFWQKRSKAPLNSVPLSNQTFCGSVFFIIRERILQFPLRISSARVHFLVFVSKCQQLPVNIFLHDFTWLTCQRRHINGPDFINVV